MNLKLSELRRSKGLTQKQAALLCGVPEGTYKCYEYNTMSAPILIYDIIESIPDAETITKDDVVDNATLGKFLEKTRLSKNLTMHDIATKIGMTKAGYCRYEQGQIKAISMDMLGKIAEALSINVSDLEFKDVTVNTMPTEDSMEKLGSIVDNISFGKLLEKTRTSKGLLMEDVAAMVGMTRPGYRRYEHGQIKNITKDVLSKIVTALSLDVKDLESKEGTVHTKAIIELQVHSEDITAWLRTSDSTQWVAMAYYNYLKYKQRKS